MTARSICPAAGQPAAEFVHWFNTSSPLGDPAQCGSPTGRATRVASAVTCPKCIAWMNDEAWTGHTGPADADTGAVQVAEERDQYAAEACGLRERLAAALVVATEQASLIGALCAQLHAAGLAPIGQGWRIGAAA